MTTPAISTSNPRSGAVAVKAREGGSADGKGFSTVLSLRMGMGLSAAVGVAPNVPVPAHNKPAESARATPNEERSVQDERSVQEKSPAESARADEAGRGATDKAAEDAEVAAEVPEEVPELRVERGEAGEAIKSAAGSAEAGELARAEPATTTPEAEKPEVVKPEAAAAGSESTKITEAAASGAASRVAEATAAANAAGSKASERPIEAGTKAVAGTGEKLVRNEARGRGAMNEERRGVARESAEEAASEPAGVARDPLGLIRERPTAAEVVAEAKPVKDEREAAADLSGSRTGQPEVTRTRFADAEETATASRAVASAGLTTQGAPASSQAFAPVVASKAAAGVAAVGSAGGVGGAAVGSGGGGGGAEFGGLFNGGGRAFGAVFGATVRGAKVATGAGAPTKGESKEQIQAQISRGLAAALRQKGGVMSLRLNPEHLGSMKIDLSIEGGRVTAVFDAQSEQARQILRDGVDGLKRSIEQTGLVVKSIEVAAVSTLPPLEQARAGERGFQGTADQQGGRDLGGQAGGGQGSGGDRREGGEGRWAAGEVDGLEAVAESGGVWAESDGSASGLLRLRVDAVV